MRRQFSALLFALFAISVAHAETGVTDTSILIGASLRLSGPGAFDGQARKNAMEAIFKKTNVAGGIQGRKLELVALDDKGDKKSATENTETLIKSNKVFALLNYVGPTAIGGPFYLATKDVVPYLGVIQGGEILRKPVKKSVFVVRPSGEAEIEELVKYAVEKLGIREIAILSRDDSSGQTGRAYVLKALQKRDLKPAAIGTQPGDESSFEAALKSIIASKAKAVFMATVGKVGTDFVNAAAARGFNPIYLCPSAMSPKNMLKATGKNAEGSVFAFGYPSETTDIPVAKEFKEAMEAAGFKEPDINMYAFEAYVNAKVAIEGLKLAGKNLTRPALFAALETMKDFDIGGLKINFSPTSHQGFEKIFLTQIKDGKEISLN